MQNWLNKLKFGLKKSSSKITSGITDIFTKQKISLENIEELEEILLLSDIGYAASSQIIKNFSSQKIDKNASSDEIKQSLAAEITSILHPCQHPFNLSSQKPHVVLMIGVNGAGKTTTIGKMAHLFKNLKISLVAGDTFRAAAVEQLKIWGERNNVKVYSGASGCDAAGLCFDALNKAKEDGSDLIFIDTAGRLQNKTDLTDELKKIIRVIQKVIPDAPHHTLLVLDATTGQNALDQVKTFKQITSVDGLIINKLDGTAKGGILVAIAKETPLPVYFIGVGEKIDDLLPFDAAEFTNSLLDI